MSKVDNNDEIVKSAYIDQIMKDMENGVMAVRQDGHILYANRKMNEFFEQSDMTDMKIQDMLIMDEYQGNEAFWDTIIDVVHNHDIHRRRKVYFTAPSQKKYCFQMTSSYLSPITTGTTETNGIVITISDETHYEETVQKRHDATIVLIAMLALIALTNFVSEIHTFTEGAFPHTWIARFTEICAVICLFIFLKFTSLKVEDFGIMPKRVMKELFESLIVVAIMALGMYIAKIVTIHSGIPFFTPGAPLMDWARPGTYYISYIFITLFQEFLSRCALQQNLYRVLSGKYQLFVSICITTLLFGAIHLQHGLIYMVGAAMMNIVLSVFYHRHHSLLGTFIIHYFFGILGVVLSWTY